ncbi:hypothetical protein QJS04_geneDACA023465 [Acorus gramineus]|uniref:Uncharacterized protein n=1 Tax=Acorus gramineus TaxID=55184 RepID=A0AAV9BTT2_ACOGR|nr:hypothetical protein QJS04_geneDACA023465 [Acorus gramineus]
MSHGATGLEKTCDNFKGSIHDCILLDLSNDLTQQKITSDLRKIHFFQVQEENSKVLARLGAMEEEFIKLKHYKNEFLELKHYKDV